MQALSPRVPLLPLPQLSSSHTGPSEAHPTTLLQWSLLPLMSVAVPPQEPDPGHPLWARALVPLPSQPPCLYRPL